MFQSLVFIEIYRESHGSKSCVKGPETVNIENRENGEKIK